MTVVFELINAKISIDLQTSMQDWVGRSWFFAMLADRPPAYFTGSLSISYWTTKVVVSPSFNCNRY